MKRSDMILNIATEIVLQNCKINWDIAQTMAEAILKRIENDGMVPPIVHSELFGFESEYKWEEE